MQRYKHQSQVHNTTNETYNKQYESKFRVNNNHDGVAILWLSG